ncbi:MAG: PepSY-associated TM helix domain-containing protein [Parvibaculaceae bacterium]|nr:PepSY-associated TM helix domain-containing protein [Parvibaculaceae bacterium]
MYKRQEDEARVIGAFKAADISKFDVTLRYTGVKGDTLVFIDRETGLAEIEVEPASLTSIIHNLHRGKEAGAVWKAIIDISAIIILAMSLVGFVLFLSLRLRLATSMKVIASSVVGLGLIIWLLTP